MTITEQEHVTYAIKSPDGSIRMLAKNGSLDDAVTKAAFADGELMRVSQDGRAAYPVRLDYDAWGEAYTVRSGQTELIDKSPPPDVKSPEGRAAILLAAALNATPRKPGWAEATENVVKQCSDEQAERWRVAAEKRAERLAEREPPLTRDQLANAVAGKAVL